MVPPVKLKLDRILSIPERITFRGCQVVNGIATGRYQDVGRLNICWLCMNNSAQAQAIIGIKTIKMHPIPRQIG